MRQRTSLEKELQVMALLKVTAIMRSSGRNPGIARTPSRCLRQRIVYPPVFRRMWSQRKVEAEDLL